MPRSPHVSLSRRRRPNTTSRRVLSKLGVASRSGVAAMRDSDLVADTEVD